MLGQISMKQLLEAGVHFGHQTRRWNPKMKKYIYTERNQIYIIDLKKTLRMLREAYSFVRETVAAGGTGIFVGTKKQAKDAIEKWAYHCGMYYVNNRWLGGTLTNYKTIRKSINRMIELQAMVGDGSIERYSKKEQSRLLKEKESLEKNLQGIRNMEKLPQFVFVVDPSKEHIAVHEANKCGIPVVAVVDTNCDPDPIDYVIPGNDDAIRSINLACEKMAEASIEGMISRVQAGLQPADTLPEYGQQIMARALAEEMGVDEETLGQDQGAPPAQAPPAQQPAAPLGALSVAVTPSDQPAAPEPTAPPAPQPAAPPEAPAAPPQPETPTPAPAES